MFYKQDGVSHYRCANCGAVDNICRGTEDIYSSCLEILRNGCVIEGEPDYLRTDDSWYVCGSCGRELDDVCTLEDIECGLADADVASENTLLTAPIIKVGS